MQAEPLADPLHRQLLMSRDAALAVGALVAIAMIWVGLPQIALVAAVTGWLFGAALHQAGLMSGGADEQQALGWAVVRWRRFRWTLAIASFALALNMTLTYGELAAMEGGVFILAALLAFELVPIFALVGGALWLWGPTVASVVGVVLTLSLAAAWVLRHTHRLDD